ncbi:hypothetical protein D3C72_2548450 [compost metagenome]
MRTEIGHQLHICGARDTGDVGTEVPCDLHRGGAHGAGGANNENAVTGSDPRLVSQERKGRHTAEGE